MGRRLDGAAVAPTGWQQLVDAGDGGVALLARIEPEAIERERAESSYLEDLAKFVSLRPRRD